LDVAGKIGINDTQVLFLPDQTNFEGTLILGTGGGSLSHSSGNQGRYNTAIGIGALNANTPGYSNTAIGYNALYSNTTGFCNTASGNKALYSNTEGGYNTANGFMALYNNTEGNWNTAGGYGALYFNSTGSRNTTSGHQALFNNSTGSYNVGIGYESNYYNQAGANNTIIGYQAGRGTSAHDKSGNVFIGYQAGYNETGSNKLYIENSNSGSPLIGGDFSTDELYLNGNVGIGTASPGAELDVAGKTITSQLQVGTSTTAGYVLTADASGNATWQAGGGGSGGGWTDGGTNVYLTTSTDKVGIGDTSPTHKLDVAGKIGINDTQVLFLPDQTDFLGTLILGDGGGSLSHSSGNDGRLNTAIGRGALNANTTGYRNTASGFTALAFNTEGFSNTANGVSALYSNITGDYNTASGHSALHSNITGMSNTGSGDDALYHNTTGSFNVGIGSGSNYYNQEGLSNTIIGFQAGRGTSEHNKSGNVFIGYRAGYNETGDNKLYIENSNSDTPLIGGDFLTNELFLNANVGIGTSNPGAELDVAGKTITSELTVNGAHEVYDGYLLVYDGYIGTCTQGFRKSYLGPDGRLHLGSGTIPPEMLRVEGDAKIDGAIECSVLTITGGSDIAEPFDVEDIEMIKPGMVLSIDSKNSGKLIISEKAYDRCVAGIISGAGDIEPGMMMSQLNSAAEGKYPVALTGRVYCWADASNGAILPGDLLTTSDTPGHTMKVTDYERAQGAVIGKAMSSLEEGRGLVLVLVTLQ
jgi:hypothetical protein